MNQQTGKTTVTIIGAGLGGIALVANLGLLGYRLRLHDRDPARIAKVRERGGLDVEGLAKGFAPLELVTDKLAPAVEGADVIIVVTGSHFHADVARDLAGVLRDGQSILLIQGGTGGALVVRRELRAAGCRTTVDVSEMDNYPYSLGWPEPTRVKLTIVKRFLQVASLPAARIEAVLAPLRPAFPRVVAAPNILTTGLTNMNATLHVANMVGNIGRLEGGGNAYRFYAEGYTPSLVTLLEALDAERLAVAKAYGARVPGIHQWLLDTYGLGGDSLHETFHRLTHERTGPYQWTPTPPSLQHKYVVEDVPCGLVAMSELGRAAGVATPVIDGLIALTSAMLRRDFRAEGRNLEQLGLAGKGVSEIRSIVDTGSAL
ncbi:MAG: NAD/NADP octopine/nopaline dehydrogenase family protein [Candidatus Rokuibacteriota bacterium]